MPPEFTFQFLLIFLWFPFCLGGIIGPFWERHQNKKYEKKSLEFEFEY